ncbi:MAG: hypothetical protein CENE_02335 [Candidatus Celerinatantimonas neptuna]|nr:MAG: hypothetical protein CENE_02335 [Candidatus Celerinatantimonas neptuna]
MKSNSLIIFLLDKLVYNKFKFQDPRMPNYIKQYNLLEKRMDSPVYRCALESICKNTTVTSFLEIVTIPEKLVAGH